MSLQHHLGIDTGEAPHEKSRVSRRSFLKLGGLTGAGLIIGMGLAKSERQQAAITAFEPSAYLKVGVDGKIIIYSKNPEIGQGVKTSMPQVIAEELEVDWQQIEVQQAPLDSRLGAQFAGGSTAIKTNFEALRKAGAAAREMLTEAAARKWNVPLNQCEARQGFVHHLPTQQKLSYGELAEAAARLELRENPKLKARKDFKIIGKPLPGVDNKKIVTGTAEFGLDARPRGMRVAVIERCPVYGGRVKSVDDTLAFQVPGVEQVVIIEPTPDPTRLVAGVAVIARNTWAAMKGRKALKVVWDTQGGEIENDASLRALFENNVAAEGQVLRNDGNVASVFGSSSKVVESVYEAPFLAHAPMEPMNYIADVREDGADLWGPTQVPGSALGLAAALTGLARDKIKVRMTRVGGGFGRRLMADYCCEAIHLSKTIQKPVQVVWTREDDLQHDFYRPSGMFKLKAALDENNRLVAWHLRSTTTSRYAFRGSSDPAYRTEVFPDGFPAGFVPNFRMEYLPTPSKVPRGAWRAPGHNITAWVDQCFIDEVAHAAGKDPVAFRLELLGDEDKEMPYGDHGGPVYSTRRLKNVIRLAAEKSKWAQPPPKGIFRGFAAHFMFGAYVAEVVSISIPNPGTLKLENVTAVVDCGLVINQSGALNQLEGGIIDGLSSALNQAVHIEQGSAKEKNFDSYRIMRIKDAPLVTVHLVESDDQPEGLGEMSLPPVAAALCNAIFAATGKRIRKLPVNLSELSS